MLSHIDYGLRAGSETVTTAAPARVWFTVSDRCWTNPCRRRAPHRRTADQGPSAASAADIVAVDQCDLITLFTQGSALAAGHRNVRAVTADAAGDLGIEPGTADLVVASCVANNMLSEIAVLCPDGDADVTGYARWYHALGYPPLPAP